MCSRLINPKQVVFTLCLILSSACAQQGNVAMETRQPPVEQRKITVECEFPAMAAPSGPALVAQEYGANSPIPLNAVLFTSPALKNSLVVQRLAASLTATHNAQVYARFINCTEQPLKLGVRTSFLSDRQVPVEPTSAWKTVWVQGLTTGNYLENSISQNVSSYLVEVRDDTEL